MGIRQEFFNIGQGIKIAAAGLRIADEAIVPPFAYGVGRYAQKVDEFLVGVTGFPFLKQQLPDGFNLFPEAGYLTDEFVDL